MNWESLVASQYNGKTFWVLNTAHMIELKIRFDRVSQFRNDNGGNVCNLTCRQLNFSCLVENGGKSSIHGPVSM